MSTPKINTPITFRENIVKKLNNKINDDKKSINLEKAIFNYSLKEADNNKVFKKRKPLWGIFTRRRTNNGVNIRRCKTY